MAEKLAENAAILYPAAESCSEDGMAGGGVVHKEHIKSAVDAVVH